MKIFIIVLLLFPAVVSVTAQNNKQIDVAFMNVATARPFSRFGSLLSSVQHPGIEFGYSFNWKTRPKHDWYQEIKLAWFYHRYVQHAIPLYTVAGYRYKFSGKWMAKAAVGGGYLHSIPATAQLKLQDNGEYKNGKGIGRMQGLAVMNLGISYITNPLAKRPLSIFITYEQMIQTPFINSYVPLLPYNSILAGISVPLQSKK